MKNKVIFLALARVPQKQRSQCLMEYEVTEVKRDLLALPVRLGGLGLLKPPIEAISEYKASAQTSEPPVT